MAERRSQFVPRRIAVLASIAGLLLAASPAAGAHAATSKRAVTPLSGWLGNGTTFPNRALVLSAPAGASLSAASVHVTENGVPAGPLSVTPTTHARSGDFGVMVLVDQSASMARAPLAAAIGATRSFAAQRTAQQELGLITFDSTPSVFVHLTSDSKAINFGLSRAPRTGTGANVPAAISLALRQLANARVALGAVVVISDGVGKLTAANGPTPASVQTAAAAVNVPIITVGLQDSSATAASLRALSKASPGQFIQAPISRLTGVFKEIYSTVTRGYVVRWRSRERPGQTVKLVASASGVPGSIDASYSSPATPAAAKLPDRSASAQHQHRPSQRLSSSSRLAGSPSFALQSPPARPDANTSFWASPAAVPVVAGICGLLIALAAMFALYRPSRRAVRTRVGSFIPGSVDSEDGIQLAPPQHGSALTRRLERSKWWPVFVLNVEIAQSSHTPAYLVKRAALIGVVLAALLTVLSGTVLVGMVALLGWPFALRTLMARAAEKQRDKFRDTLPGYLQDLASAMRVGRSFIGGIAIVADSADEPIHGELDRAVADESLGRPLDESLESVAKRMQAPDMDQVALIAALNKRSGSNVAEALERVAEGARERAELRREVKALTAQAKMSSWVLTSLPGFLLLGMTVISPLYAHPLLHTTIGRVLLGAGACMVFAGWKTMQKITNVEA